MSRMKSKIGECPPLDLHIPLFKASPLGEYPTLAMFIRAMTKYHMDDHIKYMKEILQLLGDFSTA
jgi:hypothetical protein